MVILPDYVRSKQNLSQNLLLSALVPGTAQLRCRSHLKGGALLAGSLVAAGTGLYFFMRSNDEYDRYECATVYDQMNRHFDDSERYLTYSNTAFAVAGVLWVFNIYDTYRTTRQYNESLYYRFFPGWFDASMRTYMGGDHGRAQAVVSLVFKWD